MMTTKVAGPADDGGVQISEALQWASLEAQGSGDPPLFQAPPVSVEALANLARERSNGKIVRITDLDAAAQNDSTECTTCLLYTSPSPRDGLLS
eukprot:2173119-Pleurochrysis_carterae.AAC.1